MQCPTASGRTGARPALLPRAANEGAKAAIPCRANPRPLGPPTTRPRRAAATTAPPSSSSSPPLPPAQVAPMSASDPITTAPAAAPRAAKTPAEFDWHAAWWPVAALDSLDPARPHQVYLLGQRLVVWRDDGGDWRAFADICPHRGVPLSEGRIEGGGATLACAYHGWQFAGDGTCVDIPQAIGPDAVTAAAASPKACGVAYPVAARPDGLLWVWPKARDFVTAAATPTSAPPISEAGAGALWMANWFVRDVSFSVQALGENGARESVNGARERAGGKKSD